MRTSARLVCVIALGAACASRSSRVDEASIRAASRALVFAPHEFVSDRGDTVPAELAYLRVPENRQAPNTRTIELAVLRFRCISAPPGDPIVYLAGGPGGSAIRIARGVRFDAFMALRAAGDVIALDQRGAGMSRPSLECPQTVQHPLGEPLTYDTEARRFRAAATACADYWRSQGVDFAGYNTEKSADDLEALRQAIGTQHLVLWGVSYGSHLGLATLRRYPQLASRAIFAGVGAR